MSLPSQMHSPRGCNDEMVEIHGNILAISGELTDAISDELTDGRLDGQGPEWFSYTNF